MQDYSSALELKSALLPPSSRALASVHYQIATALEFTPDRRSDALSHVEKAISSFRLRLAELSKMPNGDTDARAGEEGLSEEVKKMTEKEREKEVEDVTALIGDLEVKVEELKAAPPAGDFVSESINHLLGSDAFGSALASVFGGAARTGNGGASGSGSGNGAAVNAPVNDLTGMVKKKKKPTAPAAAVANGNGKGKGKEVDVVNGVKRKGDGEGDEAAKKARVD